jgi:hypothetical protein
VRRHLVIPWIYEGKNGRSKSFEDIFAKFRGLLDLTKVQGSYSVSVKEVRSSGGGRAIDSKS